MFYRVLTQLRDIMIKGTNLSSVDKVMNTGKFDLNQPIDKFSKQTLLMLTVSQGKPESVIKLLEYPIDLFATD